MIILLDSNVVLDVVLRRGTDLDASLRVWSFVERGGAAGFVSAYTFNTVNYVLRKTGVPAQRLAMADLHRVFRVAPVDQGVIDDAIAAYVADFEDEVQYQSGKRVRADFIVTRDLRFPKRDIQTLAPEELVILAGI